MYDVIVVGGGLAGVCASYYLSRTQGVLLVEAGALASGASGAAAGMVNPLMSRRARPVWRMEEALQTLHGLLDETGGQHLFARKGVLRPAADPQQAEWFRETSCRFPEHAAWYGLHEAAESFPNVHAPEGALLVRSGGALPVPEFVAHVAERARAAGAEIRTHTRVVAWGEAEGTAWIDVEAADGMERLRARKVLLALGASFTTFAETASLRLHAVKGQVVRVSRPAALEGADLPHLAGTGYVVSDGDSLVVGSSYEHTFSDLKPSHEQSLRLLEAAGQMLPDLAGSSILGESAGVRVNVPGTRLPMVGPLPGREHIWIFTGMGSKGLLMAPLLASHLGSFLADPALIPKEIGVKTGSR